MLSRWWSPTVSTPEGFGLFLTVAIGFSVRLWWWSPTLTL